MKQALPQTAALTVERTALERWRTILAKLVADEFVVTVDGQGAPCAARACTKKERGRFVLGSTVDPEATFRKHGDRCDLAYNVHVAADGRFIQAVFATTGAAGDSSGVAPLVEQQLEARGCVPEKLIYDRAAGSAKLMADVARVSHGRTQLVAQLIDHGKRRAGFTPLDFTLNGDGSLTCPHGQTTATCFRNRAADGWNYRFAAEQCVGCPLRQPCRGEEGEAAGEEKREEQSEEQTKGKKKRKRKGPQPTAYRQVFISHYREQQRAAILYTRSTAFQGEMKFRASIERVIAALVRYNDGRQARGRGLANADFQVRMAAVAYNLKKWHKLTQAAKKAQRYRPPDPPWDGSPNPA